MAGRDGLLLVTGLMLVAAVQAQHQILPGISPDLSSEQWNAKCASLPELSWLTQYMGWAREQRSRGIAAPGVKYLVWNCDAGGGNGLSDRLRGMLSALRAAATIKRVLLIKHSIPAPLEHFLLPNLIDWSVPDDHLPAKEQRTAVFNPDTFDITCPGIKSPDPPEPRDALSWPTTCQWWRMMINGTAAQVPEQFVFWTTTAIPWSTLPGISNSLFSNITLHCAFTAMFRAAPRTLEAASRHMSLLGIEPGVTPYTAQHLRLGGMLGEEDHRPITLHGLVTLARCANESTSAAMAMAMTAAGPVCDTNQGKSRCGKMVLVTDNLLLRGLVADRQFLPATWVTVPGHPLHWEKHNGSLDDLYEVGRHGNR
ncbi:hypothetical protein V8C86DRAFT_1716436 [Haematococcus lacustris]